MKNTQCDSYSKMTLSQVLGNTTVMSINRNINFNIDDRSKKYSNMKVNDLANVDVIKKSDVNEQPKYETFTKINTRKNCCCLGWF